MSNDRKTYIPSITDLISSPKLKAMAHRFNPITVFNTARSVLDEVAAEAKNVASERRMPDIYELSERIAAKLKTVRFSHDFPLINATGILLPPEVGHTELPIRAIDSMALSFGGDAGATNGTCAASRQHGSTDTPTTTGETQERPPQKCGNVREMICERTGAVDAIVVNGHAAALMLAFAALIDDERADVLTTPGDLYESMTGWRVDDILMQAGCQTMTVGSVTRATLDGYIDGANDETALLFCANGLDGCLALERELPELSQLVDFARKRNIPLLYDAEWGTFHSTAEYGLKDVPTYRDLINQGVSLLVFSCGGLNNCDFAAASCHGDVSHGEPNLATDQTHRNALAVIAGDKALIRKIRKSPLFSMFVPSRHDMAMLETVLTLSQSQETAENELPLWSLLSTDSDNLKLRAERMALQIAALPGVSDASVVATSAMLTPLRPRYVLPSQEIRVTFESKTAVEMLNALAADHPQSEQPARPGIAATFVPGQPNAIAFNMRTVFARYDMMIVEALMAELKNSDND